MNKIQNQKTESK